MDADRRKRGSMGRRREDRKWPRHARDFWMVVITGLVVLALANDQSTTHEVRANQRAATNALCAYKADLRRRYNTGIAFLKTHPGGFAGIPHATLALSIANEASTLQALSPLMC